MSPEMKILFDYYDNAIKKQRDLLEEDSQRNHAGQAWKDNQEALKAAIDTIFALKNVMATVEYFDDKLKVEKL